MKTTLTSQPAQRGKNLASILLVVAVVAAILVAAGLPQAALAGNANGLRNTKTPKTPTTRDRTLRTPSPNNNHHSTKHGVSWTDNTSDAGPESLGSGSSRSTLTVYISGGRILVAANNFLREVTLMVKIHEDNGNWLALQKIHVRPNASQILGATLPGSLRSVSPLNVCLKSMFTNEQVCYLVQNK